MTSLPEAAVKMKELEYALMTSESAGLAQLPIHLVRIVATDDDHNAWFIIPRPSQHSSAFGDYISVRLDFYKKDKPYYLCAQGSATIITEMNDVPDTEAMQFLRTIIWKGTEAAVKVKMESVEIFGELETEKPVAAKGIGGTLVSVYTWLFAPVMSA